MSMKEFVKGIPVAAETIHINHPEASYGIFCFNNQGDLFVNSDYGAYSYAWRSYGDRSFREFLSGINAHYMVGKFENNFITTTGKKRIQQYSKEKLTQLCELFIKTLKENPAPEQEAITRLYNLVNVLDTVLPAKDEDAHGILEAVVFSRNEARETLKKFVK
jgi:hypothetical protein